LSASSQPRSGTRPGEGTAEADQQLGDMSRVRFEKRSLASFGESPLAQSIDTFRNPTHHNGSMGSFGQTDSREMPPVCATHSPEFAIGFVWYFPIGFV
jgi:hypothetical protein